MFILYEITKALVIFLVLCVVAAGAIVYYTCYAVVVLAAMLAQLFTYGER